MSAPRNALSSGQAIRLVAGREIRLRFSSKSFLVTTALLVVLVAGGGFLLNLAGQSSSATTVGVTPANATLAPAVKSVAKATSTDVTVKKIPDQKTGEQEVRDGDLDVLLTGAPDDFGVTVKKQLDPAVQSMLTALSRQISLTNQITKLGGDPAAVNAAVDSASPKVTTLEPQKKRDGAQMAAGYVAGILIFIALTTCGSLVAQGVVEEKSSRVVELLLAAVRPWQLMAGKVLGIGVVGLTQVVLVVAAGAGTAASLGLVDASSLNLGATVAWAIVWFIVGFVMYSVCLAAMAALVSRQEDVGSVTGPIMMLMMIPYIIGVSIGPWDPSNPLIVVMSYIPFCSPLLMPLRIALGTVSTSGVLIALAGSLVLIPVLIWLAGRIYSGAVLRTGTRVKLRDALKSA